MKILNLSFTNKYHIAQSNKNDKSEFTVENSDLKYVPQEILGRSQVVFAGNNLDSDDNKFIEAVSRDLRFSEEQKDLLRELVIEFLKENGKKSLGELDSDDDRDQVDLLNKFAENMDLSDSEFDVLSFHVIDRLYCDGKYQPEDRRFIKDLPVIEPILEKYCHDEDIVDSLTDVLLIDADVLNCETLFDVFNKNLSQIEGTMFYDLLAKEVGTDNRTDAVIDLCLLAKRYEREGDSIFPKHDALIKFYNSLDDDSICDEIIERFKINEQEGENIYNYIIKRHDNVSLQQIGFEIADKYNLPPRADKEIIEIINNQKTISEKLKEFDDQ